MVVTTAVYLRCLSSGFVLDDAAMILRNPDLNDWSFLWKAFTREEFWYSDAAFLPHFRNYRPLLLVWYWIDNRLFGLNPAPWHASVVAVHLVVVWLVFRIARRLTNDSTTALLATSLFALTPVHVAAVVWMAGAGFVLATAFGLAAFYLIISRAEVSVRNWVLAIGLYACALLSHESAFAFPMLVACYAFFLVGTDADLIWARTRRAVLWSLPFAVEVVLYLITRRLVLGFFVSNPYDYANLLTDAQVVLTVPMVLATYLTVLTMPWLALPNHDVVPVFSALSPQFWMPLATMIMMGAIVVLAILRDSRHRLHLFCLTWIGVTLAPMLLLHSVYHLVQDYYLYLPSVGWSILAGDLLAVVAARNLAAWRFALSATVAMLVVYAAALWKLEPFWHDDVEAARGYVMGAPDSTAWHTTLAVYLEQAGDLAQAEKEVRTAISLEPDRTGTIYPDPKALDQILGEILAKRGDIKGAEILFRKNASEQYEDNAKTTSLQRRYVEDAFSLYNKGLQDQAAGRLPQAEGEVASSLDMMKRSPFPDFGPLALRYIPLVEISAMQGDKTKVESLVTELDSMPEGELAVGMARARISLLHGDKRGAERILNQLAVQYPNNPEVLLELAELQADLGQNEQALQTYERIARWTGHPYLFAARAKVLHALGRDREALDQCRLALALGPQNRQSQFTCAQIQQAIANK